MLYLTVIKITLPKYLHLNRKVFIDKKESLPKLLLSLMPHPVGTDAGGFCTLGLCRLPSISQPEPQFRLLSRPHLLTELFQ